MKLSLLAPLAAASLLAACANSTTPDTGASPGTDPSVTPPSTEQGDSAAAKPSSGDAGPAPTSDGGVAPSGDAGSQADSSAVDAGSGGQDSGTKKDAGSSGDAAPPKDSGGAIDSGSSGGAGGGGGPTGGPADMFPSDSYWYKDVSALPAYTGENIIGGLATWGHNNVFAIDFSIVFQHANASTPKVSIPLDPSYDPDNDHVPVPIPVGGAVEGETGYTCTQGGDCHLIVVDDSQQKLFELWQASYDAQNNTWFATQESVWNLTEHYSANNRGKDCTSADAAGFAVLPGLVGVREVVIDQEIKHALRYILPNDHMRPNSYVAPATHSAQHTGPANSPPMGTRLRLRASFDESTLPTVGAKVVARALKKYGMLLADGGEIALTAESDQLEATKWGSVLGPQDLAALQVTDFEVVDYANVDDYSGLNCVRSP